MPSLAQITALSRQFDAALHQFKAMDLGMSDAERYPSSLSAYDPKKKTYPSIYLSGPKDEFADLPDSGEAVIRYQVTRRSTEEENGKKRHSLTIEVRSLDPKSAAKAVEKKKAEGRAVAIATMSNAEGRMTEFLGGRAPAPVLVPLLNGAVAVQRPVTQLLKTRRAPVVMKKTGEGGEIRVSYRKKAVPDAGRREATAYYTDDVKDARGTAAHMAKQARKGQAFSEFNRPRDGDGQFVANTTGGADPVTMRQAYGPDPKKSKLLAPGAAASAVVGAAGLLGTKTGRGMVLKGTKGAARVVRSTVTGIQRRSQGRSTERYPIMGSRAEKK